MPLARASGRLPASRDMLAIPCASTCEPTASLSRVTAKSEGPNSIPSSLLLTNPWPRESSTARCCCVCSEIRATLAVSPSSRDYVRPHRPPRKIPAVQRYETKPGYQAQVDWKICEYVDLNGEVRKIPVFAMVLGYSRMMYIEFAKRCDIHSFLRCLIHALEYFGGVPKTMLTDQMKTVILGMGDDRKPRWHPLFEDFAATVGMVPKVCRVRRPQTKGKVERAVQFIEQNFMAGRRFTDVEDLNRQARQWCDEQNRRIHGTTGERPIERLAQEKLGVLPPADRLAKYRFEVRKVSRDGFVSYDGVRYGVPWKYSGRDVKVRDINGFIEIYREQELIAQHKKQHRSRTLVMCEHQYANLSTAQGYAYPKPQGIRIPVQDVEVRSLDVYERLMEVGT